MQKKVSIIIVAILLTLTTLVVSVFAWFYIDANERKLQDVVLNSRRLISATMLANLGSEAKTINFNSDEYNQSTYTINLGNANEVNNSSSSIRISLTAFKNISVRFRIVEQWVTISNGVETVVPITHKTTFSTPLSSEEVETETWIEYPLEIKESKVELITLIDKVTVHQKDNTLPSNNIKIKVSIYIEAHQSNVSYEQISNNYIIFKAPVNTSNTKITYEYKEIFTPYFTRGIVTIVKSSDMGIVTHIANSNTETSTNYIMSLNLVKDASYNIEMLLPILIEMKVSYNAEKNELLIQINNRVLKNNLEEFYGILDFIYAPSTIPKFVQGFDYKIGDIVYHDYGKGNQYFRAYSDSAGYKQPQNNYSGFNILGQSYVQGSTYTKGNIVYLDGIHYEFIADNPNTAALTEPWAWKTIGINYSPYKNYKTNEYTYVQEKQAYYQNIWEDGSHSLTSGAWKKIALEYEKNTLYNANDVVYKEGKYQVFKWTDTFQDILDYNSSTVNNADIVAVIDQGYVYSKIAIQGRYDRPSINRTGWQKIVKVGEHVTYFQWDKDNSYAKNSMVFYNNEAYVWVLDTKPTSDMIPGASRNGWNRQTNYYTMNNIYNSGDYVYHLGGLYKVKEGKNPYDEIEKINRPPHDYSIWEGLRLEWLPDR